MNIIPFDFDSVTIRTATDEGGMPWFFAQDVASALGYSATGAMNKIIDDEDKRIDTFLDGFVYKKQTLISERGLYCLIFKSKQPSTGTAKNILLGQLSDFKSILKAITDFEVPDDLPDMFVYAIRECETGRIKLGISRDPVARVKQLQTGNSQKLELVCMRVAANRFADERAIHKANADIHVRGEWFSSDAKIEATA